MHDRLHNYSLISKIDLKLHKYTINSINIIDDCTVYIKDATLYELKINKILTKLAIADNWPGIILAHVSDDKLVMEECADVIWSWRECINNVLWLHKHGYSHGDLLNNNLFIIGSQYVLGDFESIYKPKVPVTFLEELIRLSPSMILHKLNKKYIIDIPELKIDGHKYKVSYRTYIKYDFHISPVIKHLIHRQNTIMRLCKKIPDKYIFDYEAMRVSITDSVNIEECRREIIALIRAI